MIFPIIDCKYKIEHVDAQGASPHTHTVSGEIIQTFQNNGSILINGELYEMKKNGLYFIHGLATHFVVPDDLNQYSHSIITFNTPEVEKLCKNLHIMEAYNKTFTENGGTFCTLSPEDVLKTDMIFLKISNALNGDDEMKYANLAGLFTELLQIAVKNKKTAETNGSKLSDILTFISDNALSKISIDDICKHTHISKYHLCRIFKENIGVTIGEFIKSRRLSVAKQLLADTNLSITRIAEKCCFFDSGFFSKTFSKEFGITPTAFRKKYR